ncbi:MAG: 4Fe-4S ferredoxin, partial [Calditrichaeota bacterium]
MNFGFIIDNRKCIGCHACTVACKAEHDVPIGVNRTWVKYIEKGEYPHTRRLFSVMRCNHCEDAPCVEICPVQALYTRDDGIVDFDNRRCIGCKACMQACPYDALYIDPNTRTAAKCNYCAHRVDIGLEPACVNVCPEHAIISGDLDDPHSEIAQLLAREQVTARKVEKGTRPKLFYIDGDEAALKPVTAPPSTEYMWNSQQTGVGHYARYAESLIAKSDPVEMAKQPGNGEEGRWVAGEAGDPEVLAPAGGDQTTILRKALDVIREKARRVYDAPAKGVLWGWEVSAYVWTKAIAAGAFLMPFLGGSLDWVPVSESAQWLGTGIGLLFLLITTGLLIKDLDRPGRFLYVMLRPQWRSWLVRGGYFLVGYGGLLTLWAVGKIAGWRGAMPIIGWLGAIFAVLTAVYTAFLFAQARGRDFWQSPTLVLHMLIHAVVAGAAVFAVVQATTGTSPDWQRLLRAVLSAGVILNLVIMALELLVPHPTEDARQTAELIHKGKFRTAFWL